MKYYLTTNETDVFHYGELLDGQVLATGQPRWFLFATEKELIDKLKGYGQAYSPDKPITLQ